jgi:hypothetical protein
MRINVATTRHFLKLYTNQIAAASSVKELEDIEKEIDRRIRQGVFDFGYWYELDKVWFARKIELS